jgi:hypothetical protein
MDVPAKIEFAAQRLKAGHRVNRITVRDFLRHFGAERRGAAKVAAIRRILDSLDIKTEPDFETAWIDGPIWLQLRQGVQPCITDVSADDDNLGLDGTSLDEVVLEGTPAAVQQAEKQSESAPISAEFEKQQIPWRPRRRRRLKIQPSGSVAYQPQTASSLL